MKENKRQFQKYEKDVDKFIKQLKEVGVKDDTIEKIMKDIKEYQQKQYEVMLNEMFVRFTKIIKEKLEN